MPDDVPYKRQRVSKACDSCRRKKVKCDGIQPACGNCSAFSLECTYNDTTKKRGPPKGYIEAIETRLHRMESLLGGLVHSNDPRAEAVLAELMHDDLRSQQKAGKVDFTTYRNSSSSTSSDGSQSGILNRSILDQSSNMEPENKDNPIIDDLNDVMGILSIDENNQVRYHGRSSGLYLLKKSEKYKDGILSIKSRSNWSHPGEVIASTQNFDLLKRPELTELPSQELSDHLLELFFTHVHPLLPFIYKPLFFDQLKDKDHLPHLLLNAIYSFAALFSDRLDIRSVPGDYTTAGEVFFDRAKALLDNDYDKARVSTIQALLALSLREYGVGRVTRAWLWSGMAARMAQELGMHRNNEKWHPINLSREQREEQKRVFWACFVLDRIPSAHLGRPLAIDEKDVDAAHPSEDEEDEHELLPFKMEHVTVSSTSSPVSSSSNSLIGSPVPSNQPSNKSAGYQAHSVSRFNHLLKLCEIMGRIIQNVYAIRSTHVSMTTDTVLSILDSSLTSWFISLPSHLQYNPSSDQPSDSPTLVLHILYYSALMLLHQPYSAGQQSSHNICSQAANAITEIADTLLKRNILRHSLNVVVYCVFTASVIHTYNATQEDTSISQPAKVNLAKSLNVLKELKGIWPTAHKYVDLLNGLVDLKDVQLDTSSSLKSSPNTDGVRGSRKRINSSNNTQQPPSVGGIDRHARQARFRAQYSQSTSSDNDNDNDNSTVSPHNFNTVPSSSLNPSAAYQRLPSVLSFSHGHVPITSQTTQFSSSPFTQQPPARQQLRHDLPESAQMFNNTLGFRYVASNTNDPQNQPIGDTDPYAAPGMATNNGVGIEQLNSTGFWDIPHNADLNEWSSFLDSQVQSQFAPPPTLPSQPTTHLPRRVPSIPSSTTGSSLSSLQRQQQVLLHSDGNDVNMFADNHPLITDVVGLNSSGSKRSSTSFNNSGGSGNNSGTGDNSTVPLAYY